MQLTETAKKVISDTMSLRETAIANAVRPFDEKINAFITGYALAKEIDLSTNFFDLDKMEFIEKPKPAKEGATGGTDNN